MSKIDLVTRFKNPIFWVNTFLAVAMPVIAYYGMSATDFTSWGSVFNVILDALKNPYVIGLALVSLWNNIINPLTKGVTD